MLHYFVFYCIPLFVLFQADLWLQNDTVNVYGTPCYVLYATCYIYASVFSTVCRCLGVEDEQSAGSQLRKNKGWSERK